MPVIAAQAAARAAGSGKLKTGHLLIVVALAALAGALIATAVRKTPGAGVKAPAATTEGLAPFTPPPEQPVATVDQHVGGVVFTPHRYPQLCGHELSALINGGHATLFLPHQRDMKWLSNPPSEATL